MVVEVCVTSKYKESDLHSTSCYSRAVKCVHFVLGTQVQRFFFTTGDHDNLHVTL